MSEKEQTETPEVGMTEAELIQAAQAEQAAQQRALYDARRLVEREKQQRAQACGHQIQAVLRQFNCDLRAMPHIEPDGRVGARPIIVPLDAPAGDDGAGGIAQGP